MQFRLTACFKLLFHCKVDALSNKLASKMASQAAVV